MKKNICMISITMLICITLCACSTRKELKELPLPEITSGIRGEQFGIDKNINGVENCRK